MTAVRRTRFRPHKFSTWKPVEHVVYESCAKMTSCNAFYPPHDLSGTKCGAPLEGTDCMFKKDEDWVYCRC